MAVASAPPPKTAIFSYLVLPLFLLAAISVLLEWSRPDLLLVGDITVDIVGNTTPTGGAVSYAAALAKALQVKSCVVTVAGPDANLSVFDGLALEVVRANQTLTFEHTYTWWGHSRKLRVTANPNVTLTRSHVPLWCRTARVVLLGPLTLHDLDAGSFLRRSGAIDAWFNSRQVVGLMAQGFQRKLDAAGAVLPLTSPSQQLLGGLGPSVSLFLSDVETLTWSEAALQEVAAAVDRLVVTAGEEGAAEHRNGVVNHIPVVKLNEAVDTNGAGDTFATMYMIALMRRMPQPHTVASWAASRAVLQPQSCKPQCAPAMVLDGILPMTEWERLQLAASELLCPLAAVFKRSGLQQALWQIPGVSAAVDAAAQAWPRFQVTAYPHGRVLQHVLSSGDAAAPDSSSIDNAVGVEALQQSLVQAGEAEQAADADKLDASIRLSAQ